MFISKEEYEAAIATLATRVELNGLKLSIEEIRMRLEEISKRCLDDGNLFSKTLISHDDRIKALEARVLKSRLAV